MPKEVFGQAYDFLPRTEILSYEEIVRIARIAVGLGVKKVRITGGEPLLRRDLDDLIRQLAAVEGIEDLALTTNGSALEERAAALAAAGLQRVTVSLDSLDDATFDAMNDVGFPVAAGARRDRRGGRRRARARQGEHGREARRERGPGPPHGPPLPGRSARASLHRVHGRRHDQRVAPRRRRLGGRDPRDPAGANSPSSPSRRPTGARWRVATAWRAGARSASSPR